MEQINPTAGIVNDEIELSERTKKERRSSLKLSEQELLNIFPESKAIIYRKFMEYRQKKAQLELHYISKLKEVRSKDKNCSLYSELELKIEFGRRLIWLERQICRLSKFVVIICPPKINRNRLTPFEIENAKQRPIEEVCDLELKHSGRNLSGRCPFHDDKNPSFFIFHDTNSFHCFGCGKTGDSIAFVRLSYGKDFMSAVRFLNQK